MHHPDQASPSPEDRDRSAALRAQILATEHWSLLATRSSTWQEIFSRTGTFLTILSATVVALSLVVQATGFQESFRVIALLVLPIVLLIGFTTFIRLVEADIEDAWLVIGMNRLRHAYLELAPNLDRFLVTGHHDDDAGLSQTYSYRRGLGVGHLLVGTPVTVAIINSLISGVLAAIVCATLGWATWVQVVVGLMVILSTATASGTILFRRISQFRSTYHARFPTPDDGRDP
jgi:type IV secretory pathway TrbD component